MDFLFSYLMDSIFFNGLHVSLVSYVAQLVKNPPAMQEDLGSIPRLGRSPGEGQDYPLQYSCLESSMDCSPPGSYVHEDSPYLGKYWSGLPCPLPADLPNLGIKPRSSCIAGGFFTI